MGLTEEEIDDVEKFFRLYVILHVIIVICIALLWYKEDPDKFVTPEGQEVVEEQPQSGPFQKNKKKLSKTLDKLFITCYIINMNVASKPSRLN